MGDLKFALIQGHEDIDQVFSVQSSIISRQTFDGPDDVVSILDGSFRPEGAGERERQRAKSVHVQTVAYKLDEVAPWKDWVSVVGVVVKGMRL